jgi:hypothetical protein
MNGKDEENERIREPKKEMEEKGKKVDRNYSKEVNTKNGAEER